MARMKKMTLDELNRLVKRLGKSPGSVKIAFHYMESSTPVAPPFQGNLPTDLTERKEELDDGVGSDGRPILMKKYFYEPSNNEDP